MCWYNRIPQAMWLKNRHVFSHIPGGWRSKVKGQRVFIASFSPCLQAPTFLSCPHTVSSSKHTYFWHPFLCLWEQQSCRIRPPHLNSFNLNYLLTPSFPIQSYIVVKCQTYELGRNTVLPVTVVKFNIRDNGKIDNIWLNFITRRIQYHLQSIPARSANLYKQLSGTLQRVSVMKDEVRPRKFFKWKELFHIKETKTTGQLDAV